MNPWTGRRVLVTGGNGFVGGWLVDDLVRRKARPLVGDVQLDAAVLRAGAERDGAAT